MAAGALVAGLGGASAAAQTGFGPSNPFYAPSTLPFRAPPFDRIKDSDFAPALEAGMAEQLKEVDAIAHNPAAPTFDNTVVAFERSGQLFERALAAFSGITGANTNPALEKVQAQLAPRMAAHRDAIYLNETLFARVKALHDRADHGKLDDQAKRTLDVYYRRFVHAGANLSAEDKARLRKLNEEESTLSNSFRTKLLAGTREAAFFTTDRTALKGMPDAQLAAAAAAAKSRGKEGYLVALQNTTQQPALAYLENRATRQAIFDNSWTRTERPGDNDTRSIITRLAVLRADKAKLLGYPNYASWKTEDQMAKNPEAAIKFMDALVPAATARAQAEGNDIQQVIDSTKGGFKLEPWDWEYYAEQVRKARYDLDDAQVKPYFEMGNVLENGVFYAATQLYGITFKERHDIPVWHPDVRVFEVFNADGTHLALFYCDYFKRDNKQGGAWMSSFVEQSKLLGTTPVVYNVANLPKPAPGEPALLSFDEVRTMFHEFGHALHGMFSDVQYPLVAGTSVPRDFVEFPSQFNEHWASYPSVFSHYAKHYKTGAPIPAELAGKIKKADRFNQGYLFTELLAAAELDMQWHTLPAPASIPDADAFEKAALARKDLALPAVPPRYRSSYFQHIFSGGYSAGYYAYLWSEMLDDDAYQWFEDHGGLTRANGDRFRRMVLSRGNSEDLGRMYSAWLGAEPTATPMIKYRGLQEDSQAK
ncbi:MAG: M3 family metallopeptidase [Acidobacteriota bacterium]|nr:M3 family metallopeptidase [Acidobacteriota bacterium]